MFDDIRPYYDSEISDAMHRIADNSSFPVLASFVFPEKNIDEIREYLRGIDSIHDFQSKVMYWANRQIISKSIDEFTFSGVEKIDPEKSYLLVSNHRDIMLDAALLQNILIEHDLDTSEITFGANLMKGELIIDIGKSNKMFRVERPGGSMREFYKTSKHLSEYIRHTLLEKKQSVWIAQRNGRTKDGNDRTDQGIINMFRMSNAKDKIESIAELNIMPIAVSYEWEPCDILKTLELYAHQHGPYVKKPGEDLNSILTGIVQKKGRVHFEFCDPITANDLAGFAECNSNEFNKQVARLIDSRICTSYRLTPNNWIAHDILSGSATYSDNYTQEERDRFMTYMVQLDEYADGCDMHILEKIFLGIYANPVESRNIFNNIR